jgi:hypothetical protein
MDFECYRDFATAMCPLSHYNRVYLYAAVQMQSLNLDPKQTVVIKRPASEFPEAADVYLCDKCGRDITAHLYRGRAHLRQPLGPVRYVCPCGQTYLSGATEWDYLSDWEKRQWLMDIPLMFILFALVAAYATVAYFAVVHRGLIMIVVSLAGIPFALVFLWLSILMAAIPFQIAASLFRTRVFRRG